MKTTITIVLIAIATQANAGDSRLTDSFKFLTGLITAYSIHEVGHATAAWATNTELVWASGTYNQPLGFEDRASSNIDGAIVHASGLAVQVFLSEAVLQSNIDKNTPFVRGMMLFNIVNPILYALDYWFLRNTNGESGDYYQGDIEGFEHYSDEQSANILAAGMLAIAANQGYRFLKTQTWTPGWMRRDDIQFNFTATGNEVLFVVRIEF